MANINLPDSYTMPGKPGDIHIIPLSGGVDSTALAIVMHHLFPETQFIYVYTDTKAEEPEIYETLGKLEKVWGIQITRLIPEKGLIELCKSWGGFLPGYNSRYCTKNLKVIPFNDWLKSLYKPGHTVHSYIGIRADEDRTGMLSQEDWVETHMPFKEMGIKREDVFRIVEESGVGIPRFYRGRSRSGCVCCPYERTSELIYNMMSHPAEFYQGEEIEIDKLNEVDKTRWHNMATHVCRESQLARNHASYPVPKRIDRRTAAKTDPVKWVPQKRKDAQESLSMFGEQTEVWVLVEFMVHPGIGGAGIWWQQFVSFSRTRAGISKQAQFYWWHKLSTAPVMHITRDDMKRELKLAIYRLRFDEGMIDVEPPGEGSYTWKSDISYREIRHAVSFIERTLMVAGIKQTMQDYANAKPGSWRAEQYEAFTNAFTNIKEPYGELIDMDWLEITSDEPPEEDESEITCLQCSL